MATKVHEGFKLKGQGLTPAVILTVINDHITKDKDEPISIEALCEAVAEPRQKVIEAIEHLAASKLLKVSGADISEMGSLRIKGYRFEIEVDQKTFAMEDPEPPERAYAAPAGAQRQESGICEFDAHGRTYHGEVGKAADQEKFFLYVQDWVMGERPAVVPTADDVENHGEALTWHDTMQAAWDSFDARKAKEQRWDTGEHAVVVDGVKFNGLIPGGSGGAVMLQIRRLCPGEATSTLVDENAFDDEKAAWDYFDEYVKPVGVESGDTTAGTDPGSLDTLFVGAARFIIESGQVSAEALRKHYSIGYGRSTRIIGQLEQQGVVGPKDGSNHRSILVTAEELDSLLEKLLR